MALENELVKGAEYYIDSTGSTGIYAETKDNVLFFISPAKAGYCRDDKGRVMFPVEGYDYKEVEKNATE